MKIHSKIGPISRQLCWLFDGCIIGSSVDYLVDRTTDIPKDLDIIIPLDNWIKASKLIPNKAIANSFGGFKFQDDKFIVDVWADDAARVMTTYNTKLYFPKFNIELIRVN